MPPRILSQREIADRLGISTATVSLVLRDPDTNRASEETKQRIFKYAPAVRRGRSPGREAPTVLYVMRGNENRLYFQHACLHAAKEQATELGLKLEVVNPKQNIHGLCAERNLKGIVLESPSIYGPENRELLQQVRTVTLNAEIHLAAPGVSILHDHFNGYRLALEHLLEKGHRRIGFLGNEPINPAPSAWSERGSSFASVCKLLNIDLAPDAIQFTHGAIGETHGRAAEAGSILDLWLASETRPTAIACHNDNLAAQVISVAIARGLRIPQDLSIIGYDNESFCDLLPVRLTSISPGFARMGRMAVAALEHDMFWDTENTHPCRLIVPAELSVRQSVATLGAAAPSRA